MYEGRVVFGEPGSTMARSSCHRMSFPTFSTAPKQDSENDRHDRRMLFEVLGIEQDESTKPMFPDTPDHPYKKERKDFLKRLGRT